MKNIIIFISSIILIAGCSFKETPNISQYKANSAFTQYKKNFLSDENLLASSDLKRAIKYAKTDANLDQLATIYLGECALNNSVGIDDSCTKYKNIEPLVDDINLKAYYSLIRSKLTYQQITLLPKEYQQFSLYINKKDFNKAFDEILKNSSISSTLISANLIKDKLSKKQIEKIIKLASFYGYKKSVLYWLNRLKNQTTNQIKKNRINKKIMILKSKLL